MECILQHNSMDEMRVALIHSPLNSFSNLISYMRNPSYLIWIKCTSFQLMRTQSSSTVEWIIVLVFVRSFSSPLYPKKRLIHEHFNGSRQGLDSSTVLVLYTILKIMIIRTYMCLVRCELFTSISIFALLSCSGRIGSNEAFYPQSSIDPIDQVYPPWGQTGSSCDRICFIKFNIWTGFNKFTSW